MSGKQNKEDRIVVATNRKARFEYELLESFEAGLVLSGSEVKSLRDGKANLDEAYIEFDARGQASLRNAHISPYAPANRYNHEPTRPRDLLLHKSEVLKLRQKVKEKGLTLVPTQLYFRQGWCKVEFALARGKKLHDKRASIKDADARREAARAMHR